MKKTNQNTVVVPIHLETGKGRVPGWGGVAKRVHEDFIPSHMASDLLNYTNRQGIQSYNIGTISTRPGYADAPTYQILSGSNDTSLFNQPSRLLAKFFPGQANSTAGKATFSGSGLNDLTLTTAVALDANIVVTIDGAGTPDTFSWTQDGVAGGTAVAITGASQQIGDTGWYVTFAATTGHTLTNNWTLEPTSQAPQILRIGGLSGVGAFQKWTGTSWTNITASGYTQGTLKGQWYPQWIIYDVPAGPYFVWVDPVNGLHVYDGTTDTKVNIPKYNDTSNNITGALWLAQVDGRLIVAGNITDSGQADILYVSAAGYYNQWESHNGGGQIPLYAAAGMNQSQVKRITGLAVLHGQTIAFVEDSRFVVSGIIAAGQVVQNYPGFGCFSGKTIVNEHNALYWWGKDGAYEWNGNEPVEIGQLIMPELYTLKMTAAHKFFGFSYEGQWWTNVKRTDGGYRNFVYDFATHQWFIFDIPMVAAYTSLTGVVDVGYLYFASPEAVSDKYKHYVFGVDPLNSHVAVYADKVTGATANARTGTAITANWTSGRIDFDDIFVKDFWLLHARIGTASSTSLAGGSSFTTARVSYNLDDGTGFSNHLDFTQTATTPYHALSFAGTGDTENETQGTLLQIKVNTVGTKRLDIKKVYVEFIPKQFMKHET